MCVDAAYKFVHESINTIPYPDDFQSIYTRTNVYYNEAIEDMYSGGVQIGDTWFYNWKLNN